MGSSSYKREAVAKPVRITGKDLLLFDVRRSFPDHSMILTGFVCIFGPYVFLDPTGNIVKITKKLKTVSSPKILFVLLFLFSKKSSTMRALIRPSLRTPTDSFLSLIFNFFFSLIYTD